MSHVAWESGHITLPAASVAAVKQALRDATNAGHDQARAAAATFWEDYAKRTRSPCLYRERLEQWLRAGARTRLSAAAVVVGPHPSGLNDHDLDRLHDLLEAVADKPRKLTAADIQQRFPKVTNRAGTFAVGAEATIRLDGRELTWHVRENNHAVEVTYDQPVMCALMNALSQMKWTRATGGTRWGADEYATDAAEQYGDDPVSVTGRWGPLGDRDRVGTWR